LGVSAENLQVQPYSMAICAKISPRDQNAHPRGRPPALRR
jgi:hypothetical protein